MLLAAGLGLPIQSTSLVSVPETGEMGEKDTAAIIGSVVGGVLVIIGIGVLYWYLKRRNKEESTTVVEDNPVYNDPTYYQDGNGYTKDRNTYY